jgi:uncharacterized protein YjbJ (UPF0337 family)
MSSIRKTAQFFLSITLMLVITVATSLGLATSPALAGIEQPTTQIAWGFGNKAEATAKGVEGKVQESVGNVTGDPKDQIMGKAKQAEGKVRNTAENLKDNVGLEGRAKAIQKNIEGNLQETAGKVTNSPQDQAVGKAKQAESQVRNAVEDAKSAAKDLFN